MAEDNQNPPEELMSHFLNPNFSHPTASIRRPQIHANNFEIKASFLNLIQSNLFEGDPIEDPNRHITKFLQLCSLIKANGVPPEEIRLMMFPFSLKGRALNWLELQPANSISTWEDLVEKFQKKFFPLSRFSELKEQIDNFKQLEGECLCVGWGRFKELIRRCPQYVLSNGEKVRIFYKGVTPTYRVLLNAAAGGSIGEITPTRAIELIEKMASEDNDVTPVQPKKGVLQLDGYDAMLAKQDKMDQRLDSLVKLFTQNQISAVNSQFPVVCDTCGGPHTPENCDATVTIDPAQVHGIWNNQRRENPYGNTYNPSWRNHPGLSYKSGHQQNNANFQQDQPNQKAAWEVAFEKMTQSQTNFAEETRASFKNQEASIKNLENQIGQLARQMAERPPGNFPSDTIVNPKGQCKAITTRSGIVITPVEKTTTASSSKNDSEKEKPAEENVDGHVDRDVTIIGGPLNDTPRKKIVKKPSLEERMKALGDNPYVKAPYPQRLKQSAQKQQYSKFLEMFKKLQINIPFVEALENMPSYAKFMKSLLSRKHKLKEEMETVSLTAECSAIIQKKIPPKLQDPDRSIKRPEGVVEDVLVKVNDYIFPADFVVLDMEADTEVPLLLGRPFLATARVLIDVEQGELLFRVNGEQFTVNVFEAMKCPEEKGDCFQIDVIDKAVAAITDEINAAPTIAELFAKILQTPEPLNGSFVGRSCKSN
ncbi:uncharacterized protein LOC133309812 [Gastrolobium bilobum]|uniref:uncharacterized protein LOC133309812 n=1 Tax=Gastrolobium bilobum TaxID=150636 RepID=UPI002AB2595C|nr:uncharacterized protein LOC133309812 [Gastrolobium bilobum]